MNKTKIEWVKNPDGSQGYTWNPITGCLNGCEYCYARKLANGRLKSRYLANPNWDTRTPDGNWPDKECYPNLNPFYPRFWEDRLAQLDRHNISRSIGVFVCDMSDLFGIGIPEEWTRRVLGCIEEQMMREYADRFYLLTKQPQNLIKFSPFSDNCWVGVTLSLSKDNYGNDHPSRFASIASLKHIKASVKYISFEPLLGQLCIGYSQLWWSEAFKEAGIKWVIIGSQTKPYKPPKIEWVEEIVRVCDKAKVPVFLKDNLMELVVFSESTANLFRHIPGIPSGIGVRQEMPQEVKIG